MNGNGHRMGLNLVLDANIEDYSGVTNGEFYGFKVKILTVSFQIYSAHLKYNRYFQVLIHQSEHFPDVSDRGFVLGPGTET